MRSLDPVIRGFKAADLPACTDLLRRLPSWFGLEESNRAYLAGLGELPSFVALLSGSLVGFASLRHHNAQSAELEILAVDPDLHRRGIGRALVSRLEGELRQQASVKLFHVKTLGPSAPDENYARTRAFYTSLGFVPLLETEAIWGPENPALLMVKTLA